MDFYQWLADAAQRNGSLLCVGLDTRPNRLPPGETLFGFNRRIVDAIARRDPAAAEREMTEHLTRALEDIRASIRR